MFSFFFLLLLILILFVTELLPLIVILIKGKESESNKPEEFLPISIIIPTRDEEKVINSTIEKWINIDYPSEKEIIFCDHSKDRTPQIIKEYAKKIPYIRYLHTDTGSKLGNILMGVRQAKFQLIVLNDADKFPEKDSVYRLVSHLTDKRASVFSKTIPRETKTIFQLLTSFELVQKYIDQKYYSIIDSVPYLSLSNCVLRKDLLMRIPPQSIIADDVYLAVKLREMGKRSILISEVGGVEEFAGSFRELIRKRLRVSQGTMQIFLQKYVNSFLNKKFGYFGLLVVPLRMLYFFGVNLFLLGFLTTAVLEKSFNIINWSYFFLLLIVLYFTIFVIYLLRVLLMKKSINYWNSLYLLIVPFYPFYYLIFFRLISVVGSLYFVFKNGFRVASEASYWKR